MKRCIGLFLLTCASWSLTEAQDSLAAIVYPDSVVIRNIGVDANCVSRFRISVDAIVGDTIVLTEVDTVGPLVNCDCTYDLTTRLTGLGPGEYTVNVHRQFLKQYRYEVDTTVVIGSTAFTIVGGVAGARGYVSRQSECYQSGPVGAKPEDDVLKGFDLQVNYPNPFNPATVIRFTVPHDGPVLLTVSDAAGRRVAVLVDERKDAGTYSISFDGKGLTASGVYFYRLQSGDFVRTRKMVLLR